MLPSFNSAQAAEHAVDEIELAWNALKLLDLTQVDQFEDEKALLNIQAGRFDDVFKAANRKIGEYNSTLANQREQVTLAGR